MICDETFVPYSVGISNGTRLHCARTDRHDGMRGGQHQARRNRWFYEWWNGEGRGWRRGKKGE